MKQNSHLKYGNRTDTDTKIPAKRNLVQLSKKSKVIMHK